MLLETFAGPDQSTLRAYIRLSELLDSWPSGTRHLRQETYALFLAYKDPRVPWYAKLLDAAQGETGERYRGVLYGQFMATSRGPVIVEVNVRFGDPEAINVLSVLESNPVDVSTGVVGTLWGALGFRPAATVVKHLVSDGYPDRPSQVNGIRLRKDVLEELGTDIIFAGAVKSEGVYATTGSRFAAVLGVQSEIGQAYSIVEETISHLSIGGLQHRQDVASPETPAFKRRHMQKLRESTLT